MTTTIVAKLDNRKRISLSAVARSEYYTMTAEDNGRITLVPSAVVPQVVEDFRSNSQALAALAAYDADPSIAIDED